MWCTALHLHLQGQARCELGELTAYQLALAGAQLAVALQDAVDSLLETVLDVVELLLVIQHDLHWRGKFKCGGEKKNVGQMGVSQYS